jgi:hypothetical protein
MEHGAEFQEGLGFLQWGGLRTGCEPAAGWQPALCADWQSARTADGRRSTRIWRDLSVFIRVYLRLNGCRYFASRQLSPTPTSTSNGTSSLRTDSISDFTILFTVSTSSGGASNTSSSWT